MSNHSVRQTGKSRFLTPPTPVAVQTPLKKPEWVRVKLHHSENFLKIKRALRENNLHTVCEEASCPNIGECFGKGTATFMVLGDLCTRRCPFCDVAHGRPKLPDENEPAHLAQTIVEMRLRYVVITSVDRDDLRDGGSAHFSACIREIRARTPDTKIEILVPDFRGRLDLALLNIATQPPDILNHNLETVPRLYRQTRPGADYQHSLNLLAQFKDRLPNVPTKSGLMLGLGETDAEILRVMNDLRQHGVTMLTIGQYLQPSRDHLPVQRYVEPAAFRYFEQEAEKMGFESAACGPLVRSSYHADQQAQEAGFA